MEKELDVEKYINVLNEHAKKLLVRDGFLQSVAFFIKDDQVECPEKIVHKDDEEKFNHYYQIGKKLQEYDYVIVLQDIAYRSFDNKDAAKEVIENYMTESPLTYPESMRMDGILYMALANTGDGIGMRMYCQSYRKDKDKYQFDDLKDWSGACESLSGNLLEAVQSGYNDHEEKEPWMQ